MMLVVIVASLSSGTTGVAAAPADAPPVITPLFIPAQPASSGGLSYPCFRQPELTPVGGETLLAWTEAYPVATPGPSGNCAPPLGANDVADLVYRRSTNSGGSWGPMKIAVGNNTKYTGNIDWYTTVFDEVSGRFLLFVRDFGSPTQVCALCAVLYRAVLCCAACVLCCMCAVLSSAVPCLAILYQVSQLISTDKGASFSLPRPLALPPNKKKGFALVTPSMGHGLQLSGGRLVLPFVCGEPEPAKATSNLTRSCSLLSDGERP